MLIIMKERFSEERYLCAELVRLDWRKGDHIHSEHVVLEDISTLGACVGMEDPIAPGTGATLTVGNKAFCCDVSRCDQRDEIYLIALRFADGDAWSAGVVKPQHLTSLDRDRRLNR